MIGNQMVYSMFDFDSFNHMVQICTFNEFVLNTLGHSSISPLCYLLSVQDNTTHPHETDTFGYLVCPSHSSNNSLDVPEEIDPLCISSDYDTYLTWIHHVSLLWPWFLYFIYFVDPLCIFFMAMVFAFYKFHGSKMYLIWCQYFSYLSMVMP
jgi:hypothetical protein